MGWCCGTTTPRPGHAHGVFAALNALAKTVPLRHVDGTTFVMWRRPARDSPCVLLRQHSTLHCSSGINSGVTHTISPSEYGMSTRRDFLGSSAAIMTGALVSVPATVEALEAPVVTQPPPPAIRALRPMRDGVVPISVAERQGRLEKARQLMRDRGVAALMLTGGTSMDYFTGIRWGLSERGCWRRSFPCAARRF